MEKERSLKTLPLDGGSLPFHFINTVYAWRGENLHEYLNSYEEFLDWCRKVGLLHSSLLGELKTHGNKHPKMKAAAFDRIIRLRQLLYNFFSALAEHGDAPSFLQQYNIELQEAISHYEWISHKGHLKFMLKEDARNLLLPLRVILQSSHQLLLEEDPSRIKECPRCGWIFLDNTKNKKRRWCNPASCGSVDKMHRYYQKIKEGKA